MTPSNIALLLLPIFTYLLCGIPFGLIFAKALGHKDLRMHGSGNIGATNAVRVGGKLLGFLTLCADGLKGAIPVLLAREYLWYDFAVFIALVAVLGHVYSPWLKFKGGKGVATAIAVVLALNITVGFLMCLTWILFFAIFRISAVASLASIAIAVTFAILFNEQIAGLLILLCFILFYKHKSNIKSLFTSFIHK